MKRDLSTLDRDIGQDWSRIIQEAAAHGITNDIIFDGLVAGQTSLQPLRTIQATKNCVPGTRIVTKDGRVFQYGLSSGICRAGRGVQFGYAEADGFDWEVMSATFGVGVSEVTMAAGTHPAFEKDELEGGFILISDAETHSTPPADIDMDPQNRRIVGNDASEEDAACTIRLATPLSREITVLTHAFLMRNPWNSLICGNSKTESNAFFSSHAGVPAAYVNVAGKYFWTQTWGPLWIAMDGQVGKVEYGREVVFRWDGSLHTHDEDDIHAKYAQHAGYIMDQTGGGIGATFIMLQVGR